MNYYQLLKISPDASNDDIRKAFRKEAKQCHPDLYQGNEPEVLAARQKQFIRLTQAYETLIDPQKRKNYDKQLKSTSQTNQKPGRSASSSSRNQGFKPNFKPKQPPPFTTETFEESLEDLLGDVKDLLGNFQLDLRNPLEALLDWARQIFLEIIRDDPEATKTFEEAQKKRKARRQYSYTSNTRTQDRFEDVEDEFQKLKKKYKN